MKIILAILVIILANVMVSAQWKKGNEKVEDTMCTLSAKNNLWREQAPPAQTYN
jgi:hypothetical protein